MIEFPEKKIETREIFKISKKSICHKCEYINDRCVTKVMMHCGTDSKTRTAVVLKCDRFEESKK